MVRSVEDFGRRRPVVFIVGNVINLVARAVAHQIVLADLTLAGLLLPARLKHPAGSGYLTSA